MQTKPRKHGFNKKKETVQHTLKSGVRAGRPRGEPEEQRNLGLYSNEGAKYLRVALWAFQAGPGRLLLLTGRRDFCPCLALVGSVVVTQGGDFSWLPR